MGEIHEIETCSNRTADDGCICIRGRTEGPYRQLTPRTKQAGESPCRPASLDLFFHLNSADNRFMPSPFLTMAGISKHWSSKALGDVDVALGPSDVIATGAGKSTLIV